MGWVRHANKEAWLPGITLLMPSSQMYFQTSWEVAKELFLWTMGLCLLSLAASACAHQRDALISDRMINRTRIGVADGPATSSITHSSTHQPIHPSTTGVFILCSAETWSTAGWGPLQTLIQSPGHCTRPRLSPTGLAVGCTTCTPSSWMPADNKDEQRAWPSVSSVMTA